MGVKEILEALYHNYANFDYKLSNTYVFAWESDFFAISKSGYIHEVEIKVSRSDFFADFKKTDKHIRLKKSASEWITIRGREHGEGRQWNSINRDYELIGANSTIYVIKNICPHKFYYAVPEGLIKPNEVPEYAGLFYITDKEIESFDKYSVHQQKSAKFLHKRKINLDAVLKDKFYFLSLELKRKLIDMEYDRKHDMTIYPFIESSTNEQTTLL